MRLKKRNCLILLVTACLPACAQEYGQDFSDLISKDYENIYVAESPSTITLDQALNLALENNLDAKIAERDYFVSLSDADLQKLNALPSIVAKSEFITRSNVGASSSISAETGVQSLEPSISTD